MSADETSGPNDAQWTAAWIEQQRELLRKQAEAGAVGGDVQGLYKRWLDVGRTYLGGLQEFAQQQDGSHAPLGSLKVGEELLEVWRSAWVAAGAGQQSAARALSDMFERLPPLGLAREHTEAWRELAATQAECQHLEQELRGVLLNVQSEALNLLDERVRERQASDQPIKGYRDLYDLWVECAEQVFAKVAHSDAYGRLQGELGNASMRLRSRHQKVIEYALRQFDLPTRSELNSVHRQVRELKQQLAELRARSTPPVATRKTATPPRAAKRRTTRGRTR